MRHLCWFDEEPDQPSTPIEWRAAAAILASLFFNFTFWIGVANRFWLIWEVHAYGLLLAGLTLLATILAVVGPGAAALAHKRSLPDLVENSLGALPVHAVRWICAGFSILWVASCVSLPVRWWSYLGESLSWKAIAVAATLPFYLLYTGLQSFRTTAKLAFFTNKLGIALLIAALWRVRDGWSAVSEFHFDGSYRVGLDIWWGFSELVAYLVPFGFLAAGMARRLRDRKQASVTVAMGVTLPLFVSLLVTAIISVATRQSFIYQPSLEPNMAMALFGRAAYSALPGRWMIATITTFGAARFCIRSTTLMFPVASQKWRWIALITACFGIGWLSFHPFAHAFVSGFQFSANCLGVMSAIITADLLSRREVATRRIDWPGCAAFLVGILLPWYVPHGPMELSPNPWWYPWLLPCYAVALVATIAARILERAVRATSLQNPHKK
jgi:hypothetical protein